MHNIQDAFILRSVGSTAKAELQKSLQKVKTLRKVFLIMKIEICHCFYVGKK